jgi:D-threonate/D-erythronate kinase
MSARWLILADDLTGAADCAIAFAKNGLDAQVFWGEGAKGESAGNASVLSVDADSRRFSAADAAARQLAAQAAHWQRGMRLYKKIDSTIRGQPAAELAAQLEALGTPAPLAVMAPAFPATGRLTRDGRVVVNDQPLEQTPLWARDHTYASAYLPEVLASAGLSAVVIDLATVRAGRDAVYARMRDATTRGVAAVVCDCAAESDLAVVAEASLALDDAVWVGSAGLAAALAKLVAPATPAPSVRVERAGAVLTVVGSLAEASRLQARTLVDSGRVTHLVVAPDTLLAGSRAAQWRDIVKSLSDGLGDGRDVLLEIGLADAPDLARGAALAASLAALIEEVAPLIGALVATGGETACALLSRLGVHGIRLIDEVEPGVPFGVSLGARAFPVVTKAGAFGNADTLRRSLDRLKSLPTQR